MSTLHSQPVKPLGPGFSSNTPRLIQNELSRAYHSIRREKPEYVFPDLCAPESYQAKPQPNDLPLAYTPKRTRIPVPVPVSPAATVIPRISGRKVALPCSQRNNKIANPEPREDSSLYYVVRRNESNYPRVSFFPHDGQGTGVAMGLAFYQEGMVMKQSTVDLAFGPMLRDLEFLPFTLKWPGYSHILAKQNIFLIEGGRHVTNGRIAQQVAQVFSEFIQRFGDDFDDSVAGGIQLGPRAVTFHSLRLHQVYIRDGRAVEAEVSYTRRK